MKKGILCSLAMVLFLTLSSVAFSAEEALTPERISGIWKGYLVASIPGLGRGELTCQILITPGLTAVVSCSHDKAGRWKDILDVKGAISDNQLVIRQQKEPETIRLKAYITSKNRMEGYYFHHASRSYDGDLIKFKKVRDLSDEEKQQPLSQLKDLVK